MCRPELTTADARLPREPAAILCDRELLTRTLTGLLHLREGAAAPGGSGSHRVASSRTHMLGVASFTSGGDT